MDAFAEIRRRAADTLIHLGRDCGSPPGFAPSAFSAKPCALDRGFDVVVDAALVCAGSLAASGLDAKALADRLAAELSGESGIESAAPAGPGFVNVTLTAEARSTALADALRPRASGLAPGALPDEAGLGEARRVAASEALARIDLIAGPGAGPAVDHWGAVRVAPPHATVGRAGPAAQICGAVALRFALASGRPSGTLCLDLPALAERCRGNPAFSVRYAHARLRAFLRRHAAAAQESRPGAWPLGPGDLALLDAAGDGGLARAALRFPHAVAAAASARSAHPLAAYLSRLADGVHEQWRRSKDQPQLRFVNEEGRDLASARLRSATASALVLGSGLGILGVTAPDEMA